MEDSQKEKLRDYAWKYFALHAAQRMQTFNFYLVLSSALIVGSINIVKNLDNYWMFSVTGLLLVLFSYLFARLDKRNKELVRNGEDALKFLEDLDNLDTINKGFHPLNIFTHDDTLTRNRENHFSYSSFLSGVFLILSSFGIFFYLFGLSSVLYLMIKTL